MSFRILNQDGTFNIAKARHHRFFRDTYHFLLSLNWTNFLLVGVLGYFVINLTFALGYFALGPGALAGATLESEGSRFMACFFFSVQTFGSIGYGKILPNSHGANGLVVLESLTGLLSTAMGTGLAFARFSRPVARVRFSEVAVVHEIDGVPCFLFRLANERQNFVAEAEVTVSLVINEQTSEGERFRNFHELKLESSRSPMFAMTWTVIHPMNQDSPLRGHNEESLRVAEAEFIVTVVGIDETLSSPIHARFSYIPDEIRWNRHFVDVLSRNDRNEIVVDLERLSSLV